MILAGSNVVPLVLVGEGVVELSVVEEEEEEEGSDGEGWLTIALNLVINDVPRVLLLLSTLPHYLPSPPVKRLLLVVPDHHYPTLSTLISHGLLADCYPTTIIRESILLHHMPPPSWDKYAIQMALKLLVSTMVDTDYYLTLDADVIAVGPLPGLQEIRPPPLHASSSTSGRFKAVYVNER